MKVKFWKAQGAGNDFLFTFAAESVVLPPESARPEFARAICDRHHGIGADGWYLVEPATTDCDARLSVFNSDGSGAELSGNGTRCAAALMVYRGLAGERLRLLTGAGPRELRLTGGKDLEFVFEMNMGTPTMSAGHLHHSLPLAGGMRTVTILNVGNPQCVVAVDSFDFDWKTLGAEIEGHSYFPQRTNVSFIRAVNANSIESRFYERGAGYTKSSGTGSTGAAVAAILLGLVHSPVRVVTEAGDLEVRWEEKPNPSWAQGNPPIDAQEPVFLAGPAQIIGNGEFFW